MNVLYTYVLMHVQCIFFFISGIYAWSECTKKELDFNEQWKIKNECGLSFVTRLSIILQIYVHLKCMETDRQLLFIYIRTCLPV